MTEKQKYENDLMAVDSYIEGNQSAGEKLFADAFPLVKRFVYSKTKGDSIFSIDDKEDIIAESLIRSVDKLHLYNGSCAFSTFVVGYAKFVIFEFRRKKSKETTKVVSIDCLIDPNDIEMLGKNPINVIIEKEKREAVLQAIEMLSIDHKQILMLRLFNEMPFKQLVEITGKSEDSVDAMFRRAVKAFKNNFNKIYNGATD